MKKDTIVRIITAILVLGAIPISAKPNSGDIRIEKYGPVSLLYNIVTNSISELRLENDQTEDYHCSSWKQSSVRVEKFSISSKSIMSIVVKDPRWGRDTFDEVDLSMLPQTRRALLTTLLNPGRAIQITSRGCGAALIPDLKSIAIPRQMAQREPVKQTPSGPVCQIITIDQGPSISIGSPISVNQRKMLEDKLPALRKQYPGRTLEVACEGGE